MPNIDFTESERAALARFLREAIDGDRFPLSPRVRGLKALLAKVDPQPERPVAPLRPPKPYVPSTVLRKSRRR